MGPVFGHALGFYASRMAAALAALVLALPLPASACRDSLADVVEPLIDAVVNISTTQNLRGPSGIPLPSVPDGSPFEEFFRDFFQNAPDRRQRQRVNSLGSGFVIDPSGLIVTNNHVIAEADEIEVNFNDGTKLKVEKVLGRDQKTDLALLQVRPKRPLVAVRFGDSTSMRVGDCVIAIGNPFGLGGTVTTGIISAKKRDINNGPYDEYLQTDAAINKGNSGGPLFNLQREVIGVNTAIISPTGGSIGIGFANPSETASLVVEQLRKFGRTRRGWIGVRIQSVSDEIAESLGLTGASRGALISSVNKDGPADRAGLQPGDIILQFDGRDVESMRMLPRLVARTPIDVDVAIEVLRKGKMEKLTIRVEQLDEEGAVETASVSPDVEPDQPKTDHRVLGLTLRDLDEALRREHGLEESVAGAVITGIAEDSPASTQDLKVGDVIVEVTQEKVVSAAAVEERVEQVRRLGRPRVLLLVTDSTGDIRFVAVPLEKSAGSSE
ncbi:MAG: Do family serine endopeptidase [Rhizobiales bacterium]|nr:Do family serine endopeptidase [Hyphomicrobiales bacterium]